MIKTTNKHYSILKKSEDIAIKVLELVNQKPIANASANNLKEMTKSFKQRISNGEKLDSILIESFAVAHKAIEKIYGINLYKVQIMGAFALYNGDVAEMKTGEGKTLTAILPAYLNSLEGKGVHIVTVNEYLATRDSLNTGRVFELLGLKTGLIISEQTEDEKRIEYSKDVTYMTNSELGFDYLRDNLVKDIKLKTQRSFNFAIIDEVDSILIDEARTPLIISGGSEIDPEQYIEANNIVKKLNKGDFEFDMETNQAYLTHQGAEYIEKLLKIDNLYSYSNSELVHRIHNALQAHHRFKFNVDYTVKNDEIVLIDIFTGRFLEGRQYSNGLNQAIEAKEEIKIKPETKVYASITYQNLFRMYKKLSGMSGTAATEEEELFAIYNMRVIPIPTNKQIIRVDKPDMIFSTRESKFNKVVDLIKEINLTKQPILVGTRSVHDSEFLSNMLNQRGIKHEVLNAKNHSREADIIKNAGQLGSITISTNMAGRGTDIVLGKGVLELGGLFVIGTERHESRRIDYQLRGRSGRQGDIGITQFIISLDDEIMNRAGLKRIQKWMNSLDAKPIESKFVAKSITIAQKKLEGLNYDSRKNIIEYDDVLNQQRILTYKQRDSVLNSNSIIKLAETMIKSFVKSISSDLSSLDLNKFSSLKMIRSINENIFGANIEEKNINQDEAVIYISDCLIKMMKKHIEKNQKFDFENQYRQIILYAIDSSWQDQIERLNRLKNGIRYRQYAQKNPVQDYVFESDKLFDFYKKEILQKVSLIILREINKVETKEILVNEKERQTKDILIK